MNPSKDLSPAITVGRETGAALVEALRSLGFDHAMVGYMRAGLTTSDGIIDGEDETASLIMAALVEYLSEAIALALNTPSPGGD
jgi:hypothetical protein